MRELFDIIRANPWPFAGGLSFVILMIIIENFGRGIENFGRGINGDGAFGDFFDSDGGDGGGGD